MPDQSKMIADTRLEGRMFGVFFNQAGKPVLSAERIQRAVAIFESRPITAYSEVISWNKLIWSSFVPSGTRLYLYTRSAQTEDAILSKNWAGPFLNEDGEDISSETGKVLQFKIAMYAAYDSRAESLLTPTVSFAKASCYVRGASQEFYTSAMKLDFNPKHVLLTYNGTVPEGSLVKFAVSTIDSTDTKNYKIVDPNTVVGLEEISNSNYLKVAIFTIGNTEIPFVVDEFAVAIGGDGFTRLTK
jgi:hypothetical protein